MFGKKMLRSCVAFFLFSSPALAADIAGRFTMDTWVGQLTLDLHPDHGHYAGTLHHRGHDYPVIASQIGHTVIGNFIADGKNMKFIGTFDGSVLTMNSNGSVYTLQKTWSAPVTGLAAAKEPADSSAANPAAAKEPADAPAVASDPREPADGRPTAAQVAGDPKEPADGRPTAAQVAGDPKEPADGPAVAAKNSDAASVAAAAQPALVQVQMQQGRFFRYPLPQGWQPNETDCGVDLRSPDGLTIVSHAMNQGVGQVTIDQVFNLVRHAAEQNGCTNVRVASTEKMPAQAGGVDGAIYQLTCDYRGVACRSTNILIISNRWGGFVFDVIALQAPADRFTGDVASLLQLGQTIVVTNPNAVCGNDRLIRFTPGAAVATAGSTNPVGDTIVRGEQARNQVRDQTFQRIDDSVRGVTRWGADGSIVAPNTAARVFVTNGGTPLYDTRTGATPPPNATEVSGFNYDR